MKNKLSKRDQFFAALTKYYGEDLSNVTRADIVKVCEKAKINRPQWVTQYSTGRAVYDLTMARGSVGVATKPAPAPKFPKINASAQVPTVEVSQEQGPIMAMETISFVPEIAPGYVPFGHFNDIRKIIKSGIFYPTYVQGLTGNGKTFMIEQACARSGREMLRANITIETDEDDLLGGFRLIDGRTVWQNGPVVIAMERGAVLLLDEVDLGSNKLLCLQPVLEGKPIYLKKINKVVKPAPGFTIFATANTKGQGSDDGKYIGTNVLNEAFLERFSITMLQDYPKRSVEVDILTQLFSSEEITDADKKFIEHLTRWSELIRATFNAGGINDIISTRRLVGIINAYQIFNRNRAKAIDLCLNRFDNETRDAFTSFYKKIDEEMSRPVVPDALEYVPMIDETNAVPF